MRAGMVSDRGHARENNEDAGFAGRRLIAVADGVGGMPGGELASEIAIEVLADLERESGGSPLDALQAKVELANARIRDVIDATPDLQGMATTLTAILLDGQRMALVHVGDSRAYLLRDGELTQLTRDDTYVQALVDRGAISAEEARNHPQRSLITQAVQGEPISPSGVLLAPRVGDRLLLCSDGLSDMLDDDAIALALREHADPRECGQRLVELALEAGGRDNVTVVVADLVDDQSVG